MLKMALKIMTEFIFSGQRAALHEHRLGLPALIANNKQPQLAFAKNTAKPELWETQSV